MNAVRYQRFSLANHQPLLGPEYLVVHPVSDVDQLALGSADDLCSRKIETGVVFRNYGILCYARREFFAASNSPGDDGIRVNRLRRNADAGVWQGSEEG